jgi:hypothetical protein
MDPQCYNFEWAGFYLPIYLGYGLSFHRRRKVKKDQI